MMAMVRVCVVNFLLICLAVCVGGGCSAWNLRKIALNENDVHPQLEERQAAAIEAYETRRTEAELQAVRNHLAQGNVTDAQSVLAGCLQRHPENRAAHLLQAELYLAADDEAEAERTLRAVLQEHPNDVETHQALALLLDSSGRSGEAQQHFAAAGSALPDDGVPALGEAHHQRPPVDRLKVLQAAQSAHAKKLVQRALAAFDAGDIATAHDAAKAAMEAERNNQNIPLALSVYLLKSGRPHDAVILVTHVKDRFSSRPDIHRALGAAHLMAGNLEEAQVVLQTAVSLDSAHPLSYFLLGQVLHARGQPQRAAEMLRQAHRLDPRYAQRQ